MAASDDRPRKREWHERPVVLAILIITLIPIGYLGAFFVQMPLIVIVVASLMIGIALALIDRHFGWPVGAIAVSAVILCSYLFGQYEDRIGFSSGNNFAGLNAGLLPVFVSLFLVPSYLLPKFGVWLNKRRYSA